MAFLQYDVNYPTVAVTAATLTTVVGVKAPANQALKVLEASSSFDGATSSNAPAVVDLVSCTFATNSPGTNSTSVTPTKRDPGRPETIQATAGKTWTTEPTVKTISRTLDIAQFDGLYHYINPFASPYIVKGGGGFTIQVTSPNNVNTCGHLAVEE